MLIFDIQLIKLIFFQRNFVCKNRISSILLNSDLSCLEISESLYCAKSDMSFVRLLIYLLLLTRSSNIFAQDKEIRYFNTDNGLENAEISCITEYKNGVLFLGSMNGLIEYNSSIFLHYKEPDSLNSNYVLSIACTENEIFFSTISGLYSFDGNNYTKIDSRSKLYSVVYHGEEKAIYYSRKDSVYQISLTKRSKKAVALCGIKDPEAIIKHITVDSKNVIYLSTSKGLYMYRRDSTVKCLSNSPSFFSTIDSNGILLNINPYQVERFDLNRNKIAPIVYRKNPTETYGIDAMQMKVYATQFKNVLYIYAPILSHNYLEENKQKEKKAYYENTHLYHIDLNANRAKADTINLPESITSVSSIYADSKGSLWMTTFNGLYNIIIPNSNSNYHYIPSSYSVVSISSNNGKVTYSNQSLRGFVLDTEFKTDSTSLEPFFSYLRKMLSGTIYSTEYDKNGKLLVATLKNGVAIQESPRKFRFLDAKKKSSIICMSKDSQGNIYTGGNNGIYMWDGNNLKKLFNHEKIDDAFVFNLYFKNNILYIASSAGLYCYMPSGLINISEIAGVANVTFSSICIDDMGRIIAGSYDKGVYIFQMNGKSYTLIDTKNKQNGLSANSINSMAKDKSNRIWISTSKGIDILIPTDTAFNIKSFESTYLYKLNNWPEQILHIDSQDNVYIGGKKGLLYLNAKEFMFDSTIDEKTIIQNIKIDNQPIHYYLNFAKADITDYPQNLSFKYNQNNLSFEYTAVDFYHANIKYQFYLEGIEKTWNIPTADKSINYRNLPPGKYVFHVRHGHNGLWSKETSLTFNVEYPWWRSWLFYILIGSTSLIAIYTLYQNKLNKIKKKHHDELKEKETKLQYFSLQASTLLNQMKPHFIFNALAPLQNFIYKEDKVNALNYLNTISSLFRKMLTISRDSKIRIENEIDFLNQYLNQQSIQNGKKFEYKIHCGIENTSLHIPSLMLQPLIENTIQHGFSTNQKNIIKIELNQIENDYVLAKITENGHGFNLEEKMKSNQNTALNVLYDRIQNYRMVEKHQKTNIEAEFSNNTFVIKLNLPILE